MKTSISDSALGDAVRSELEWDPKVDQTHIGVAAADGAVTRTGYVRSYAQEHAAVRAAERIYGVRAVADELEVRLPQQQAPQQHGKPFLAVRDPSLFDLAPVSRDNDQTMLLAREIDTAGAFVHRTSLTRVAERRPTGEVPWRMLIDGPSVGRRPVAAPGASHRREALVSFGPSARQASRALSRRWSATSRRYEPRRSTPAMTTCERTLKFQRTSKANGKVDQ